MSSFSILRHPSGRQVSPLGESAAEGRGTSSACVVTERMTRRHCGRRRWAAVSTNGRRQVGVGHRAHRARPRRRRHLHSGRARDVPANPDLHPAVDHPQGRAGVVLGARIDHDRTGDRDADAHGPHDGHRRFFGDVVIDRQRRPSPKPSIWRIRNLSIGGVILGCVDLAFCAGCLAAGKFGFRRRPAR